MLVFDENDRGKLKLYYFYRSMELIALDINPTSPKVLLSLLAEHGLQPSKHLGQNFLIDSNIAHKIIAALELKEPDRVIEVGPGVGALTLPLAMQGVNVLAIEIDGGLSRLLEKMLNQYSSVKIINADILKFNWDSVLKTDQSYDGRLKLLSNLPYNISGPFLYAIFSINFPFESAVLMLQKEVAHRLLAAPGGHDYSGLSVICQYYTKPVRLFSVSGNVFWPKPGVDSTVIKLEKREKPLPNHLDAHFSYLVQNIFQQRRKTMSNNLRRVYPLSRSEISAILQESSIDPQSRPEQLSVAQFANLASITYNYNNQ